MSNLYSLNTARPAPLPFRITMPDGFTRTDPSTFTAEEISAAGFTGPYSEPTYDPTTEQLDWVNGAYVISPLPPPPIEPRWLDFSTILMSDGDVNVMLGNALSSSPGLYGGLTIGLNEASHGDSRLFLSSWNSARNVGIITEGLANNISAQATSHDLPEEFVNSLTS